MAEIKWIKITTDIFDDEKIKLIDAIPERDTILVIWFKLLTLAGKSNGSGYLLFSDNIPYDEEMLSTLFNRPINSIRLAISTFKRFKMIVLHKNQNNDEEIFYIANWEKHQNIEGMEKIREQNRVRFKRYYDSKKKLPNVSLTDIPNVSTNVIQTQPNDTDIDVDIELDKDKDKDKDINKDINNKELVLNDKCNNNVITFEKENKDICLDKSKSDLSKLPATPKPKHIKINFNYNTGKFENITDIYLTTINKAYPLINLQDELNKMAAWLISNIYKRKSNFEKFINSWLSKTQDKNTLPKSNIFQKKETAEEEIYTKEEIETIKTVIEYFNKTAFKNYSYQIKETQKLLKPLIKIYSLDVIKAVIQMKGNEWHGGEFEKYLTPDTLFKADKFEKYYNSLPIELRGKNVRETV